VRRHLAAAEPAGRSSYHAHAVDTPDAAIAVCIEVGSKRAFASALDWPGWCRSGRDEQRALAALASAAPRYAVVAAEAGLPLPVDAGDRLEVVERLPGSATTDFGAPGATAERERGPLAPRDVERVTALLRASWTILDRIVSSAPARLRKGPRGGGRDRDQVVDHVLGSEVGYGAALGLRLRPPDARDPDAIATHRARIVEGLVAAAGGPVKEKGWWPRYAARRLAWHVLDHAWEIEDRSD
jgi:hypothetical protein